MSGGFNLSALAVRERSVTLFLICLISLAGLLSFFKLGRAEDPAFTVKVMTIVTAWPGASAREMQDQVAEKIEKRLQELRWYERAETYTTPGLAFTTLTPARQHAARPGAGRVLPGAQEGWRRGGQAAVRRHRPHDQR